MNFSINLLCLKHSGFLDLNCSLYYDEHIRDYVGNSLCIILVLLHKNYDKNFQGKVA